MKIFVLPDLGEGLPDAEIHEWYVNVGDNVTVDQPMAAMETAKAVVDVPAPRTGVIAKFYGKVGDIIQTGMPLVEFTDDDDTANPEVHTPHKRSDAATVAGAIEVGNQVLVESATGIRQQRHTGAKMSVTPAVRALAEKMKINLDSITGSGPDGRITASDVLNAKKDGGAAAKTSATAAGKTVQVGGEPLRGVRRAMATIMAQSHAEIVPVTISDDADIHTWPEKTDITARVIRAIIAACHAQPELNAWFNTQQLSRTLHKQINLGIAMDSTEGLFVPVLKNIQDTTPKVWREKIDAFKKQVQSRSIPQEDLHGATIILSNFGNFAGRYANPVLPPPCVAIIGTGRIRDMVVPDHGKPAIHKMLPLSVTIDHRAVTGGELTRFLAAFIEDLQKDK